MGKRTIAMDAYLAFCEPTEVRLTEHLAGEWITPSRVYTYRAPADIPLLDDVIQYFETASLQSIFTKRKLIKYHRG